MKTVLRRAVGIAVCTLVCALLFLGVMGILRLAAHPLWEICTDLTLPASFCGTGDFQFSFNRIRQLHQSTQIFLILLWVLSGYWMDRESSW
jgi:hypothetical protein